MTSALALTWSPPRLVLSSRWSPRPVLHPNEPSGESDEWWIQRALRDDPAAFDELYRRHVPMVWRLLTRILGPDPDREDLAQQIFLEVFRGLRQFRGDATFPTFLYRVVTRAAFEHLRRRRKRPDSLPVDAFAELDDPGASPERRAQARQQLAQVWALLDRIKPKKRIAYVLRVLEGLSLDEVARFVDARPAAVAQRVRHAHLELEKMLSRRGIDP